MTFRSLIAACLLGTGTVALSAEDSSEVQQLQTELQQLRTEFARVRQQQDQRIEELTRRLEILSSPRSTSGAAAPGSTEQQKLEQELAAETSTGEATHERSPELASSPSPAAALPQVRTAGSYMNLSFGTLIDAGWSTASRPSAQLELGDHDPSERGFSLRNAEIAIDGAVDPYFQGFANVVLKLDGNNATEIELEETFLQSTSLPANFQVRAGQYFANFGRQNSQHPHTWAFADQPLILNRAFGPEGLRSLGAQLSWLAPTPFYTELFLSVLNGRGGTSFSFRNPGEPDDAGVSRYAGRATIDRPLRGAQDILVVPRIASSFELTDTQTLVAGVSGAFGPNNTGADRRTEIYGLDLYWKWKPAVASQGFPYVSWQTEALYRRFEAGDDPLARRPLPAETLTDYGFYSQVVWGFAPRWNVGLRGEHVDGNTGLFDTVDPFRGERTRFSPEFTFLPSEFSKIRLQYNYDHGRTFGAAHSVWFQVEFGLGAHGAHKF